MKEDMEDNQRGRRVRFQEDGRNGDSDSEERAHPLQDRRPAREAREPQKPAAYQRLPERGGHNHNNHQHSHGPTVDQSVIQLLSFKESDFPRDMDVTTFIFGIFAVVLTYTAFFFRESIINENVYDKFQESRIKFAEGSGFTMVRLIPEAVKFFSLWAYDILIVMYLIKPLKNSTKEERELVKQYQEILKRVNSVDKASAQELIKKGEQIQAKRSDMLSYRYTNYNSCMNMALKTSLSLNFIIASLGLFSYFITAVLSCHSRLS